MKPSTVGFDDDDDDDEDDEDEEDEKQTTKSNGKEEMDENDNTVNTEKVEEEVPQHMVNGVDMTRPLCSDDDDTDDGEDLDPADRIMCQFTKVTRKKNDWAVDLKHGIMHINGKDYAFQKAIKGKFQWE